MTVAEAVESGCAFEIDGKYKYQKAKNQTADLGKRPDLFQICK